jgi:hypothetical protein
LAPGTLLPAGRLVPDGAILSGEEETVPSHPSYPNPQLVEALCEIHFRHSAADPWKPSKPGGFFKAVQDTYPEIEPITQQGVQLVIGPDSSLQPQLLPPQISFRLKHRERPLLLQVSEADVYDQCSSSLSRVG